VQFKQELVIAFVRRTDGLQILASNRTFPADHLFRPCRDGAPISLEPDVREHPRPAAVAVHEGVDLDGEVMEAPAATHPECVFARRETASKRPCGNSSFNVQHARLE